MTSSSETPNPQNRALNATVFRLGLVSFFADVSSEMLYPITPIFLTATLGASMASVGLIEGVAEGIASLLKIYSGAWSDRIGRRKGFVVAGYFLAAISKPLIGLSNRWTEVFVARGLDRTGKGIRTAPRDALIADVTAAGSLGEAFGWHRMMDSMGAALGPLMTVGFLTAGSSNLRPLFAWALIPGLLSVAVACTVKDPHRTGTAQERAKFEFREVFRDREFRRYLGIWSIFSLVNSSDVFLLLRSKQIGNDLVTTILQYCFYNLVYSLSSPYLGRIADRVRKEFLLTFGFFVFAAVYLGFAFATSSIQLWILFGLYGFYMGATDGVSKAVLVELVPKRLKATGIGAFGTVSGITTIFASSVAGVLWDRVGVSAPFVYGAIGAFAAAIGMLAFRRGRTG